MKPYWRWVFLGLTLLSIVAAIVCWHWHSNEELISYIGTLLAGLIGGLLTMVGVLFTINLSREQANAIEREKADRRTNQVRLIIGELIYNQSVMISVEDNNNPNELVKLQDDIWRKLQTEVDWMPSMDFYRVSSIYLTFVSLREYALVRMNTVPVELGTFSLDDIGLDDIRVFIDKIRILKRDIIQNQGLGLQQDIVMNPQEEGA